MLFRSQKMKITASGPTTSWEIDGETVEAVSDFIFLGAKVTTDGDCMFFPPRMIDISGLDSRLVALQVCVLMPELNASSKPEAVS